jgi:exoribonuclease R
MYGVAMNATQQHRERKTRPILDLWRCAWCKGFVRETVEGYVHDVQPVTKHEVLPYRSR